MKNVGIHNSAANGYRIRDYSFSVYKAADWFRKSMNLSIGYGRIVPIAIASYSRKSYSCESRLLNVSALGRALRNFSGISADVL